MSETLMTGQENTDAGQQAAGEAGQVPADGQQQQTTPAAAESTTNQDASKPDASVPEKYDFKFEDGVQVDGEAVGEFEGIAKELGLKQDQAQKVADLGAKMAQKWQAQQVEQIQKVQSEWANQARTDKEFGGDTLGQNLSVAKQALDTFATPELKQLLNESGLGNHPEVIRVFYRVGKSVSEDRFVSGSKASSAADPAKRLFPNQA
jgi:hypothetical protein